MMVFLMIDAGHVGEENIFLFQEGGVLRLWGQSMLRLSSLFNILEAGQGPIVR